MNWGKSRRTTPTPGGWRALCAALIGLLHLAAAPSASAQNVGTAAGTAQVVVVAPLALVKARDMSLGRILPSATAGTVTVSPATNGCTAAGGVTSFGSCAAAQFVGMGNKKMRFRMTLPTSITLTGPGAAMTLNAFTLGINSTASGPTGNVNNQRYTIESDDGIFDFNIGATLHVNANQVGGTYTGTFSVTVQYN